MKRSKGGGCVFALGVVAAALSAQAQQTYTWTSGTGSANTDRGWGQSANWLGSPALTFNNQADIIFDEASIIHAVNGSVLMNSYFVFAFRRQ